MLHQDSKQLLSSVKNLEVAWQMMISMSNSNYQLIQLSWLKLMLNKLLHWMKFNQQNLDNKNQLNHFQLKLKLLLVWNLENDNL